MKFLHSSKARLAIAAAIAAAASTLLVFLINFIAPGALGPVPAALLAALAGVLVFGLTANGDEAGASRQFIHVVGHSIDDIMIGAAETSYFVDSVKKKIEKDVQTASEVVTSSEQVARTTERIASNAERAAKVAARCAARAWPAGPRSTRACSASAARARTPSKRPPTWRRCRKNRRASPASPR